MKFEDKPFLTLVVSAKALQNQELQEIDERRPSQLKKRKTVKIILPMGFENAAYIGRFGNIRIYYKHFKLYSSSEEFAFPTVVSTCNCNFLMF